MSDILPFLDTKLAVVSPSSGLPAAFVDPSELASSLVEYFARPESYAEEQMVSRRDGEPECHIVERFRPMPLVEDWCTQHRCTRRQLDLASREHPEIAEALEFARDVMKTYLIRKGLTEQYNPQFAKFVATNETNMVDRTENLNKNLNVNAKDLLDEIEKASKPLRQ